MKVKITSDSTCDLSRELAERGDIDVIPLTVLLGEQGYLDGEELSPEDIYPFVERSGTLPKTSAVSVGEYLERFRRWTDRGYELVHFCLGSGFSSSYQNAVTAARELDNVFVVDSQNLSTGQGLLVLRAADLAQAGYGAAEIYADALRMVPKVETSFVIDSLDYLYKGGRCSALESFGANLLRVKPCIEVRGGRMEPHKRYRGSVGRVILDYTADRLTGRNDIDLTRVFLAHTECPPEYVSMGRQQLLALIPGSAELLEVTAGSVITSHCGPNTFSITFFRK